ncbi:MAG: hypothetical protein AABX59_00395 [Nanoarchaeota archaeon]
MGKNQTAWIIAGIVALLVLFVVPWGGSWGGVCGMMGNYGTWGMMGYGFGWIFMIVILIAAVLLIIWLVQQIQRPQEFRRRK